MVATEKKLADDIILGEQETEDEEEEFVSDHDKENQTPDLLAEAPEGGDAVLPPSVEGGYAGLPRGVSIFEVACSSSLTVCQDVLSSTGVIGFDSEWRAALDPTKSWYVSLLLQIP